MIKVNEGRVEMSGSRETLESDATTILHAMYEYEEERYGKEEADERINLIATMAKKDENEFHQILEETVRELKELFEGVLKNISMGR